MTPSGVAQAESARSDNANRRKHRAEPRGQSSRPSAARHAQSGNETLVTDEITGSFSNATSYPVLHSVISPSGLENSITNVVVAPCRCSTPAWHCSGCKNLHGRDLRVQHSTRPIHRYLQVVDILKCKLSITNPKAATSLVSGWLDPLDNALHFYDKCEARPVPAHPVNMTIMARTQLFLAFGWQAHRLFHFTVPLLGNLVRRGRSHPNLVARIGSPGRSVGRENSAGSAVRPCALRFCPTMNGEDAAWGHELPHV